MKPIPSFLSATLAAQDLQRLSGQLYDLQRQSSSGAKADDLQGYATGSARIVSIRTAIAQNDARVDAANQLQTRFDIQDAAFTKVSTAVADLKQGVFTALSANDGTLLRDQVETALQLVTDGLNTTYQGAPLFAGERTGVKPVNAQTLDDVTNNLASGTLFRESAHDQTADVGIGAQITVSPRVSTFATDLYAAFSTLNGLTKNNGLSNPLTADQRNALNDLTAQLDKALTAVSTAHGKSGAGQKQLETGIARLDAQTNLFKKHLGAVADADLAEVAMKLSATQTQYQAAASVFNQIKDLSLVKFLT